MQGYVRMCCPLLRAPCSAAHSCLQPHVKCAKPAQRTTSNPEVKHINLRSHASHNVTRVTRLSLVAHDHRRVVDVQIGLRWLEGAPQEVRSRLWFALLAEPDLATALRVSAWRNAGWSGSAAGRDVCQVEWPRWCM